MTASIPPGWVLLLGALLVPLLRGRARAAFLLLLPAISLIHLCMLPHGELLQLGVFEYNLVPIRVDRLSLLFGYIFHIAAFIGALYALRLTDTAQHVAAFMYAGAAIGAVFAGDLITLFVYWELAAVTSVFLIWARRSERSYRAGMRYVVIQLGSGVLLLAGTILRAHESGSIAFDYLGLGGRGTLLILLAFGIKCAFPLLHNWLQDAYPEATVTGTVFLSAFTTKLAVYALVRGYPGTESLIWVGAVMTAFPIFYAVIENDLRRVLTYSMNNQLGFMVIGVGLGTEMAINGATAHAFADILFKGLLLMSIGAVLHRTGTAKASDLGGLYKSMPWSATFCVIGSMSISAFPLFSAFVTKSLIIAAAAEQHQTVAYFIMLFASVGVLEHAGIKIPFFAFFAHDSGIRCKEAPRNMLLAMAIAATLCIGIGVFPAGFYTLLPHVANFQPYTLTHVVTQLQLLLWAIAAFAFLNWYGFYPAEVRAINLDVDWIYRRVLPAFANRLLWTGQRVRAVLLGDTQARLERTIDTIHRYHGPSGVLARTWPTGSMALWVAILLAFSLLLYYF